MTHNKCLKPAISDQNTGSIPTVRTPSTDFTQEKDSRGHSARDSVTAALKSMANNNIIGTNLLTKFHEDRKINVASRVLTRFNYSHIRKNAPPPGSHVFKPTGIIFELVQDIIWINLLTKFMKIGHNITKNDPPLGSLFFQANIIIFELIQDTIETNLLTKFNEDWTINGPLDGHVFKATKTIFKLIQDIIGTNLLTKFHDDRKINVTSRVLYNEPRPRGGNVFQPTGIIFELVQDIIGINLLTKFHEDRTINVASRVKNAPPLGSHVFQANVTIFELIQDIIKTNLLTIFHQDWTINVASRVLTRKNARPPGGHVFQPTGIIFELIQDIIGMNLLTKFQKDWTINVAFRVLTIFYYSHIRKNAPPLCSHVFQAKVTIFELIQDISGKNHLSRFHEDQAKNVVSRELTRFYYSHIKKNAPPPWRPCFSTNQHHFLTRPRYYGINLLTKFHEVETINVASRVLTRFYYSHIRKNAPPLGSHDFQANVTIFELIQDIIETNLLTKFHED
ncbi:hypothetical protein DPMN_063658 [Dreissena polymorpha]|uniref:Uncharacterized protein n=1 Tax=Dreissena polymorpha TaxID=45954 RepID=A0A9D4HIT1_DREPO|nr:hypothetical protein DPMN_063658 [Dreissena polymorpha]